MKIAARVRRTAPRARLDPGRLATRLRTEIERELQAAPLAARQSLDDDQHRAAVVRALRRLTT